VTLPVIVVTGESSLETAVDAMRRGAIDDAVKPLIGDDLLAKIDWGLGTRRRARRPRFRRRPMAMPRRGGRRSSWRC
jgi:DNA-binding NtrC family response regulator